MMMKDLSDEQLWVLVAEKSDSKAFGELYDRHFNFLCCIIEARVKNWESSRDIAQEAFVNLYTKRQQLTISGKIRPYLIAASINRALNYIASASRVPSTVNLESSVPDVEDHISPDKILETKHLAEAIEAQIAKLPEKCKLVFNYRNKLDMKVVEIATVLNISLSGVENQLGRARKRILQGIEIARCIFILW